MGEIRFVGTGETRGYPYLVCKKRIVGPGKTRGYPYPVCKKLIFKYPEEHLSIAGGYRSNHAECVQCMTFWATSLDVPL